MNEPVRELSVVLPAFDEEANIAGTVAGAATVLNGLDLDCYEIIVVDDGSRDRTGAISDGVAREHDRVRVVHHDVNQGYGAALQSGFTAARYGWVFFTDSDRQFDVEIGRASCRERV